MYVKIGSRKYTEIARLQFNPETDITGSTVPVNELWVSIKTGDSIPLGERISLFDDTDKIWCKYWVTYAEVENKEFVRVHGESALRKLDSIPTEPKMYENVAAYRAMSEVLTLLGSEFEVSPKLSTRQVNGYCPKQTARVRLQWLCMAADAYVREYFNDRVQILPNQDMIETFIPKSRVFWKPSIQYDDYVTAIDVYYYAYDEDVPSRSDTYVEVDGKVYIQREDHIRLKNPNAPSIALENVVELSNMTMVDADNADMIASRLALMDFRRVTATVEVIDNGDVMPGQAVITYVDEDVVITGFVQSASFTFGLRAKASLSLVGCEVKEGALLTVNYVWQGETISMKRLFFPVGVTFETDSPYLSVSYENGHFYVLRPTLETVSGTMTAGGVTIEVQMEVALHYIDGVLYTASVDELKEVDGRYEEGILVTYS